MRRVVDTQEVPHLWFHKRQDSAKNKGHNLYFTGDTIYSYGGHFPIARHIAPGVVAFTRRSHSMTTAKHLSIVRRAIPRGVEVVYVWNIAGSAISQRDSTESDIRGLLELASRARQRKDEHLAAALKLAEDFNRYAELTVTDQAFACRIDTEAVAGADLAALRKIVADREAALLVERRRQEAETTKRLAVGIEDWRNHGQTQSWAIRNAPAALRLTKCEMGSAVGTMHMVETSHGANIPVTDAKRLWPVIRRVMAGERDYEIGMDLGGYRLTKIRRDGSIVVGCHSIAFSEIERIAVQLGLVETSEVPA